MFKNDPRPHRGRVLYLTRSSGAVNLTVLVCGGSLDMLVLITFPDLISLFSFPVQLHSMSLAVGNTQLYQPAQHILAAERMKRTL